MKKIIHKFILIGLLISIIISLIYAYIGYTNKNVDQIYLTIDIFGAIPLALLIFDIFFSFSENRFFKIFSFFGGNFSFKEDIKDFKFIRMLLYSQYIIFAIIILFLIPYGFYQFAIQLDPLYLFVSSISLIAAGAALSNMTFKHANEAIIDPYFKDVMFSGAKRFYISTIYSIITISFTIILIILSKWILTISSNTLPNAINLPPIEFSLIYLGFIILSLTLFFFILIFIATIRLFIEGIYLAFKGSIDFPNKIEFK
jgi:hypothetical protein